MGLHQAVLLLSLANLVLSCSPPEGWRTKPMMQRIPDSKVLIYGRVKEITERDSGSYYKDIDYSIEVQCVLRNMANPQINVGGVLNIHERDPPDTCVSNRHAMKEGKKVIIMLTNDYDDTSSLRFQNVNVQSAVFEGNDDNLDTIAGSCQFQDMFSPSDAAQKQCPMAAQIDNCAYISAGSSAIHCSVILIAICCVILMKQWF